MTFKDIDKKREKESIMKLLTPMDKISIIVGIFINIGLIVLYIVLKFF